MGRIDQRLRGHDDEFDGLDRRIGRIETTIDGAARGTFHTPRVPE
jgi:hypothetical protein